MTSLPSLSTTNGFANSGIQEQLEGDEGDTSSCEDPADHLLNRGQRLREWRTMAEAAERVDCEEEETSHVLSRESGDTLLYETFLQNQTCHDDLKHVDFRYIDYGSGVLIRQDKLLGKGGLCWDAAYVLADYFCHSERSGPSHADSEARGMSRIIELGCGTGLCGLLVATKLECNAQIVLTDLPDLFPLVQENVQCCDLGKSNIKVEAKVLVWGNTQQLSEIGTFDVILGGDVVATLYDPKALVDSIFALSTFSSRVFISFKERLTVLHRLFERYMRQRFEQVEIIEPDKNISRCNSPVQILFATKRKQTPTFLTPKTLPARGKVDVQPFGLLSTESSPLTEDWPDGSAIERMMAEFAPLCSQAQGDTKKQQTDYWQTSARYALLHKYGYIGRDMYRTVNGKKTLTFSPTDQFEIRKQWRYLIEKDGDTTNDLTEFVNSSLSNYRPLQWSLMSCGPACQFQLHAHPNMELVYCLSGALHEVRMDGPPVSVSTDAVPPSLATVQRPWRFGTVSSGEWLVNEIGSVHKSFTDTKEGCVLLVLWGGGHADIREHPESVDVSQAVNTMTKRLACCQEGQTLQETFLPASERSA